MKGMREVKGECGDGVCERGSTTRERREVTSERRGTVTRPRRCKRKRSVRCNAMNDNVDKVVRNGREVDRGLEVDREGRASESLRKGRLPLADDARPADRLRDEMWALGSHD
jgi:hypothetical protein